MPPRPPVRARRLAPGVTLTLVDYAPGLVQPRHRDACVQVTLVVAGGVRETTPYGEAGAAPLDVLYKAFELPHADQYAPAATRLLSLKLDPTAAAADAGLADGVPAGAWRCRPADPRLLAHFRLALAAPAAWSDPALLALDFRGLLHAAMHDTVHDTVHGAAPRPAAPHHGRPPAWLLRARDQLRAEFRGPVRLAARAQEAGVHPVTLSRAFARHFGETASAFVARLRVREAAARLASAEPLAGVAYAAGFADQAHLTRAFRRAAGVTPGRFRALARSAPDPTPDPAGGGA